MKTPYIRLNKKVVIIINGKGGAGKDTVCDITANFFKSETVSAITPIKQIAQEFGWNGEKDKKSRKFLSDLKRAFIDYNGLPNKYLEEEYYKFVESDMDILFVHIRENDQIDDFKRRVKSKCITLLIRTKVNNQSEIQYGNYSDDNVEDYNYDYYYLNNQPLENLPSDFLHFIMGVFKKEGVLCCENA